MTNKTTTSRRPARRGWRQTFEGEPGLYRLHRVDCPASPTRKRQPKCSCSFYCHHPTGIPGKTSNRRMKARDLNEAKLEKKRIQGAGSSTVIVGISPALTVAQFFVTVYLAGKQLAANSKRNYTSRFENDIAPHIGSRRMVDITMHDINLLVQALERRMEAERERVGRPIPRWVENRLTPVKSIFRYAHDIGYIARNPTAAIKPPKGKVRQPGEAENDDPKRILTEEQNHILYLWGKRELAAGGVRARKAIGIMLSLFLGLRISEALGVWWSDIDLDQCVLRIQRQWHGSKIGYVPTKTHETRDLYIPFPLLELLRLLLLEEGERSDFSADDPFVYCGSPRAPMSRTTLGKAFRNTQKLLGIEHADGRPLRFHSLRHGVATMLIRRDVPIAKVAKYLGHSSTDVTYQVYAHLFAPDLKGSADILGEAISGIASPAPDAAAASGSVDALIASILRDPAPPEDTLSAA